MGLVLYTYEVDNYIMSWFGGSCLGFFPLKTYLFSFVFVSVLSKLPLLIASVQFAFYLGSFSYRLNIDSSIQQLVPDSMYI